MMMWRRLPGWMGAVLVLTLAGCSDAQQERQSLREALARLPQDTSTMAPREQEVEEEALPLDTTAFGDPEGIALPDSVGIFDEVAPVTIEPDTAPRLTPGPPQDARPWIPERQTPPALGPEWTADLKEGAGDGSRMTVLESVRTARNDGFDRVVFAFERSRIPGYRVEYVELPVRQCGSGQPVPLRGETWLRVRLEPSQAHDDRGRPTVRDRARTADLPNVRELQLICDYEGQVEWVLGLAAETPFRVIELSSPARLVIDVRHEEE